MKLSYIFLAKQENSRDRYIPPKKIPPRKVPPGKFLLWKIPPMENSTYGKKQCSRQFWNAVEREPVKLESSILPRAKRASSETT